MIAVHELCKRFGDVDVLRGISLTVGRGEVCVLLGPSGGGKSTLLRTINGLETFEGGSIRIRDEYELTPAAFARRNDATLLAIRRRVGMVFQQFNLFPHLSTLENVTLAPQTVLGQARDEADARGRELLRRVGMDHKAHAKPGTLSGGQRQRVAIAEALVGRPKLLILDEPLSALDLRNQREIVTLLARVRDQFGVTILVVAHDLNPLLGVLDSAIYLLDGHAHFDTMDEVVNEDLLSHLYGTSIQVVHTPQGDLYMRSV